MLLYRDEKRVPKTRTEVRGLQVWPVAEALCLSGPQFFRINPREAEIALAMIRDASELITVLLSTDNMASSAARLAGALEFVGRSSDAARIIRALSQPGQTLLPQNPFELEQPTLTVSR